VTPSFPILLVALLICIVASTPAVAQSAPPQPADSVRDSTVAPRVVRSAAEIRALEKKLAAYARATAARLDSRAVNVLKRIQHNERQLLAIKGYIRRSHLYDERWAWTASEMRAFRGSPEYLQMLRDIDSVKRIFAEMNPGYYLRVNIEARDLGTQLASWNRVASVGVVARELRDTCIELLADSTFPDHPDSASTIRFENFLRYHESDNTPTVAVPGFSLHGRLRAFDFVIMQGTRTVAGTSSASIESAWDLPGWTDRLKEAVTRASPRFAGPLAEPREPWHYDYRR
jgi:hypothetical protein